MFTEQIDFETLDASTAQNNQKLMKQLFNEIKVIDKLGSLNSPRFLKLLGISIDYNENKMLNFAYFTELLKCNLE